MRLPHTILLLGVHARSTREGFMVTGDLGEQKQSVQSVWGALWKDH
jgi:hypothetical protein